MTKIAVLGLVGILIAMLLKETAPQFSVYISLASCVLIFFFALERLSYLGSSLREIQGLVEIEDSYLKILLKMVGVTYIADFSSSLCKDAGYSAIAGQIEFFGKISLLSLSLPVFVTLLRTIEQFFVS
ncbi:MAG TPA: stage III sporulation protein AD [Candidatus Limivivens merdigallinarum]|uniref:Stage III sporulation protein AD n=1 Tax=Candidatus Limivivens merdigallinarum TaxID=2840859 RepID=A0A9D0ZYM3_9FIRM|nr:stage III sporulation protein AD [Candidatus Limivivens merdigallinarum]